MSSNIAVATEWKNPTLSLGLGRHAENIYDYEWNYTMTLERCTKKTFCVGYRHYTTTILNNEDEIFNKVYFQKTWILGK